MHRVQSSSNKLIQNRFYLPFYIRKERKRIAGGTNRTFEMGRYQHLVKQTKAKPNLPTLKLSHGFTLKKSTQAITLKNSTRAISRQTTERRRVTQTRPLTQINMFQQNKTTQIRDNNATDRSRRHAVPTTELVGPNQTKQK